MRKHDSTDNAFRANVFSPVCKREGITTSNQTNGTFIITATYVSDRFVENLIM